MMAERRLANQAPVLVADSGLRPATPHGQEAIQHPSGKPLEILQHRPLSRMVAGNVQSRGTLYANLIFMSTGGGESCLDFYYLPVRDIHFAKTVVGSEISLQPVIRIPTSPVLVKQMLNLCREFAGELQSRVDLKRSPERANQRA